MPKNDTYCVGKEKMAAIKYVYAIQHNVTKRVYVGCTQNIECRYLAHLIALRGHRHKSKRMQEDFDKYGSDFTVIKLDEVKEDVVRINKRWYSAHTLKEIAWMMKFNSVETGYNNQDRVAKRTIAAHLVNFEDFIEKAVKV